MQDLAGVASVAARLEAVLARLAGRFRSMPESKLLGRLPDGRPRASAGHELAEWLAYAAQGVEDRGLAVAPGWRQLPFDGPFVVGDQIGVTGHDLVTACSRASAAMGDGDGRADRGSEDFDVWAPPGMGGGRVRIAVVLGHVLELAEGLGRGL